jgi:hypothetical protein
MHATFDAHDPFYGGIDASRVTGHVNGGMTEYRVAAWSSDAA